MNDRDVEAQPGDNDETDLGDESLDQPVGHKRLVVPPKADVSRSDQARRSRSGRPSGSTVAPATAAPMVTPAAPPRRGAGTSKPLAARSRPAAELEEAVPRHAGTDATARNVRLTSAHPLSRSRRESRGRGRGLLFGLGGAGAPRSGRQRVAARQGRRGAQVGRPSVRTVFGLAGLTATVSIVTALLVALPSQPSLDNSNVNNVNRTGSVYGVTWHKATALPVAEFDFGPYFTTLDNSVLMLGTSANVTTVWSTTDGSTWTQRSDAGSFQVVGRRFVAQGIASDGQGGLVVVGNSLGSSPTDVTASAWHSHDGGTWTAMHIDAAKGQEMAAGVASRTGEVVAAGNGVAWLSTDGSTWAPEVLPGVSGQGGSYMPSVVGSWNDGFVIIGLWIGSGPTRSTAWFSRDGSGWTQAATSLDGFDAAGIAGLSGRIVAVGSDLSEAPGQATSWGSSDGNTWTKTTAPTDVSIEAMDGVATVGSDLLAYGAPAAGAQSTAPQAGPTLPGSTPQPIVTEAIWVSDNGVDWFPIASTLTPLGHARMTIVDNRVLMIGASSSGSVVASSGSSVAASAGSSVAASSAASGGSPSGASSGRLVAFTGDLVVGPARTPAAQSAPIDFALNVTAGSLPMIPDVSKGFTLGPVTTSKDRFYTLATGPTGTSIFVSPDGSLWSREIKPDGLTQYGVADVTVATGRPVVLAAIPDGHGGIVAAGKVTDVTGDNGMIWHMTNPGTWKQVQFQDDTPSEFSSIAAGPNGFVASSDTGDGSKIMYSTDGDTWQAGSINVGSGFALTVATYHYGFVAVGADSAHQGATTAWTSPDGRTWTMRTDWHLPPNATALFGMGYGLVAAARTGPSAAPGSSASTGSLVSAAPTASGGATALAGATATATAVPLAAATATPAPSSNTTTTWWWSATGVAWQQSGLASSGGNWAIAGNQILVFDAPTRSDGNWTAWTSSDGKSWNQPSASAITFPGSRSCVIATMGASIVIVSWQSTGILKDYYGAFGSGQ